MADVFIACIRKEDREGFAVELIKGLMSRGLTVSYSGAFYNEEKDEYIYDDMINVQFLASAYFREADMKSKNFKTWQEFLESIDYGKIDEKLIIYAVMDTQNIDFEALENDFCVFLEDELKDIIVELIRNSFEMSFSTFMSHYPEIVEILDIDQNLFRSLRTRLEEVVRFTVESEWGNDLFENFIEICMNTRNEIEEKGASEDTLQRYRKLEKELSQPIERKELTEVEKLEFETAQREYKLLEDEIFEKGIPSKEILGRLENAERKIETECLRNPEKGKFLVSEFFGTALIDRAAGNPERILFFDISQRIPKKEILCLYYGGGENKKESNLYYYPIGFVEREIEEPFEQGSRMELLSSKLPPITRCQLGFDQPKELYSSEVITEIIDNHVMFALHPPLTNIHFPTNDFMLEVDDEEPEIGFLSRRINLEKPESLEENLRIATRLREKLHIYKYKRKRGRGDFHEIEVGDKKYNQKENIIILGRIEDLYRVLIANKQYGRFYQLIRPALKFFTLLAFAYLALDILQVYGLSSPRTVSAVLAAVAVLSGVTFILWTLRNFLLNYLFEPIYGILKWSLYIFTILLLSPSARPLVALSSTLGSFRWPTSIFLLGALPRESQIIAILSAFLSFFVLICGIILFVNYLDSIILHELNRLFGMLAYNDILKIRSSDIKGNDKTVCILQCGRYQTLVKKNSDIEVFFNSDLFPRIKWICKRKGIPPREIAYSSGILFPLRDKKKLSPLDKEPVRELVYRKQKTWGFWKGLENILFGKAQIELGDSYSKDSPNDRFIYFGEWDYVVKYLGNTIPMFPQTTLFRNMIILIALSGLFLTIFRGHDVSLTNLMEWTKNVSLWSIVLYLIAPLMWIFFVRRFRIRFWKGLLVLVFLILISLQPFIIIMFSIFVFFVFLLLFRFPLQQVWYFLRIWANEKWKGSLVSVIRQKDNLQIVKIQRNLLFTRMFISNSIGIEKERIYFNKRFFEDIMSSSEWVRVRENT